MPTFSAGRILLAAGLLTLLCALPDAARAQVQCPAPDPGDPTIIVCRDGDTGFDAGGASGFSVFVPDGVTVSNDSRTTIDLGAGSMVEISATGTVNNDAAGEAAASVGNDSSVNSEGTIHVGGVGGVGISLGSSATAEDGSTVTHSGTLNVDGDGGTGVEAGTFGAVDHSGTIQVNGAGGTGISAGDDVDVNHFGTIDVNGMDGFGIRGGSNNSLVSSAGSRIALQAANGTGIELANDSMRSTLSLAGTISGNDSGAVGVRVGGSEHTVTFLESSSIALGANDSSVIGIEVTGTGNTVGNAGTISVGMGGVAVLGGENDSLLNSGTLAVGMGGTAVSFAGSSADAINTFENTDLGVIDAGSGTAVLGGPGAEAFTSAGQVTGNVDLAGGDDALILLGGTLTDALVELGAGDDILSMGAGTLEGAVDLGTGMDTVEYFGGTVTGTIDLGADDDTFTLVSLSDFAGLVDGGSGNDSLVLQPRLPGFTLNGTLRLASFAGFDTLQVLGDVWTVANDSGSFAEGIRITDGFLNVETPVTLTGDLLIEAAVPSTSTTPGTAPALVVSDTLTLNGDYDQEDGGALLVVLQPGGISGRVDVNGGTATLEDGAILDFTPDAPLGDMESYTILTAPTILADLMALELPADSAVLSYSLRVEDLAIDELILDIARSPYASVASTANQTRVGAALDEARVAAPSGDLNDLLTALDGVSPAGFGAALDALHPEAYDAQTSSAISFGQAFARMGVRNLVECEPAFYKAVPDWIAEGPSCDREHWTPWLDTFGGFRQRDGGGSNIDYNVNEFGLALGVGRSLGPAWNISGQIGGGFGAVDVDGVGDGTLQILDLGLAAARRSGGLSTRAAVHYGHGWHEQKRRVAIGSYFRSPTGTYESNRVTGLLETSYDFQDEDTISLAPVASLELTWLSEEGFTESGGQGANLALDERSQLATSTSVGMRFAASLVKHRYVLERIQWANGLWRPEVEVRWRGNWTDVDRDLKGRLTDAPLGTGSFLVQGKDAGQGGELNVGITFQPYGTQALLSAGYRAFIAPDNQLHRASLDIRIPF
jgi:uncharacterized protein YhjY with autotransporter beta-barrel domain